MSKTLQVRFDDEEFAELVAAAEADNKQLSDFARQTLRKGMQAHLLLAVQMIANAHRKVDRDVSRGHFQLSAQTELTNREALRTAAEALETCRDLNLKVETVMEVNRQLTQLASQSITLLYALSARAGLKLEPARVGDEAKVFADGLLSKAAAAAAAQVAEVSDDGEASAKRRALNQRIDGYLESVTVGATSAAASLTQEVFSEGDAVEEEVKVALEPFTAAQDRAELTPVGSVATVA